MLGSSVDCHLDSWARVGGSSPGRNSSRRRISAWAQRWDLRWEASVPVHPRACPCGVCTNINSFFFFGLLSVFKAAPSAYGGCQARGLIGAVAAGLCQSHTTPDLSCDLHRSSWRRWILNPLSKARDRPSNPVDPSRICFCCTTAGIP